MDSLCPGSFDAPLDPLEMVADWIPGGTCAECGALVEIYPLEPGGADVWRLDGHDPSGRTVGLPDSPGAR
jgi:hypothetical protein